MSQKFALLSVSDKTGLLPLAQGLVQAGYTLLSTGGTAKFLESNQLPVTEVANHTGFPEMFEGRIKTLHPKIHGGLLYKREDSAHASAAATHQIPPIDVLVVNLYPFAATVAAGKAFTDCIEQIDIGGPAMLRSAAKNHNSVTVLVDPTDYEKILGEISQNGQTSAETRRHLAAKVFSHTAAYDAMIANWLNDQLGTAYPEQLVVSATRRQLLRYGENPHQSAAFYVTDATYPGLPQAVQHQGKELSYNNLNDTDAALELVNEFSTPAVAIIKHANPCGVATAPDLLSAYMSAFACDTTSAFGGIVALNRELDEATAAKIAEIFTEVIIAPAVTAGAKALLATKKNLRLLTYPARSAGQSLGWQLKSIGGGLLRQSADDQIMPEQLQVVTKRQPTAAELADLCFAFTVAKHVKSNTIVYAKTGATVGIGAGQMSRVDSARIAARKAADNAARLNTTPATQGAVAASDAFFPFADGLDEIVAAGCTAVIQPGGSLRDAEVIAAADAANLAMVFTGMRHFRH